MQPIKPPNQPGIPDSVRTQKTFAGAPADHLAWRSNQLRSLGRDPKAWALASAASCFTLAQVLFAVRTWHGLWFLHFSDEAEHLLGGEALVHGYVLYRTYIDAHGPVIFMATQLYAALSGWGRMNDARLISSLFALCAGAAIMSSSVLPTAVARLWAGTLFFGIIASVWLVQGLYLVSYHPIGGSLLVIATAQFAACAWGGTAVSRRAAFLSGGSLALACFTAYSLAPTAALLALSGLWALRRAGDPDLPRTATWLCLGMLAGGLAVVAWLAVFGDLVGYLVFHIITQQVNYARYIGFTFHQFLLSLAPSLAPDALVQTIALVCCAAGIAGFALTGAARRLPPLLVGFAGVLLLSARGTTNFQNGEFLMASAGVAALATARLPYRRRLPPGPAAAIAWTVMVGAGVAGAEITARQALCSPGGLTRSQLIAVPPDRIGLSDDPTSGEIRTLLPRGDRMLALVYAPNIYLRAGRLPMDKYYEYLPWDADYAVSPWFGRERDICADLARSPPPVIYFDNWRVWDALAPESFMPCVVELLASNYKNVPGFSDLYTRRTPTPTVGPGNTAEIKP